MIMCKDISRGFKDYESKSRQIIQMCKQWRTTERKNEEGEKRGVSKKKRRGKTID